MSKIPSLRFPGFSGDWEETTLGEATIFRRGSFPQPYGLKKWFDSVNGSPFIQVFDIDTNMKLKKESKKKISDLAKPFSLFVKKGTVVLTIQGSIGRIAITQYDSYIDRTLLIFTGYNKEIDKRYFSYLVFLLFEIEKKKASGGTIKSITKELLSSFKINLPKLPEQEKIANFLSKVDEKIENLENKEKLLEKMKKGFLQKLFPASGESVPELRFPGFDGVWVETKLGEVLEEKIKDKILNPEKYKLLTVKLHCKGIVKTEKSPRKTKKGRPYYFVKKGELLVGRQNFHNGGFGISKYKSDTYITSNAISHYTNKRSSSLFFLELYFSKYNFYKRVDHIIGGTGQKEISKKEFLGLKLFMPTLEEQQKIADFLSKIDQKITAASQEIKETRLLKKGLLQKLFV